MAYHAVVDSAFDDVTVKEFHLGVLGWSTCRLFSRGACGALSSCRDFWARWLSLHPTTRVGLAILGIHSGSLVGEAGLIRSDEWILMTPSIRLLTLETSARSIRLDQERTEPEAGKLRYLPENRMNVQKNVRLTTHCRVDLVRTIQNQAV